jgi:YD repeat-containing protein
VGVRNSTNILLALFLTAACGSFDPSYVEGLPCSDGDCPPGQDCYEGTCWAEAPLAPPTDKEDPPQENEIDVEEGLDPFPFACSERSEGAESVTVTTRTVDENKVLVREERESGGVLRYFSDHNMRGDIVRAEYLSGGVCDTRYDYGYDASGLRVLFQADYDCDSSVNYRELSEKVGERIHKNTTGFDASGGIVDYQSSGTFTLDMDPLLEEQDYDADGTTDRTTRYTYDGRTPLTRESINNDTNTVTRVTWEYDAQGNRIAETYVNASGAVTETVWEYDYDEEERMLKRYAFDLNGVRYVLDEYEYHSSGEQAMRLRWRDADTLRSSYVFVRDDVGNVLRMTYQYFNNSGTPTTTVTDYDYSCF